MVRAGVRNLFNSQRDKLGGKQDYFKPETVGDKKKATNKSLYTA